MQLAGMVIAGGGAGGSSSSNNSNPAGPFESGTDPDALAALAAGKSIQIKKRGQYTSAGGDYVTVVELGTIPDGTIWTIAGSWSGSAEAGGALYHGVFQYRASLRRQAGGSASGVDLDSVGLSGTLSGQYAQLSLSTNDVAFQIKITVAADCNYDVDFVLTQLDQPS